MNNAFIHQYESLARDCPLVSGLRLSLRAGALGYALAPRNDWTLHVRVSGRSAGAERRPLSGLQSIHKRSDYLISIDGLTPSSPLGVLAMTRLNTSAPADVRPGSFPSDFVIAEDKLKAGTATDQSR